MVDENYVKQMVIQRIKSMPSEIELHFADRTFSKERLIEAVESGDELGKQIVQMHLSYLRGLKISVM